MASFIYIDSLCWPGEWVCLWSPPRDPSGSGWAVLLGSIPCQGLRDSWERTWRGSEDQDRGQRSKR